MLYLDSSALVKLVLSEPESEALRSFLERRRDTPLVSSALAGVEVVRAARLADPPSQAAAVRVCNGVDLVPLAPDLLDEAANLAPDHLRSLDAIQLASALRLVPFGLDAVVAYDRRLLSAAAMAELRTASPGATG